MGYRFFKQNIHFLANRYEEWQNGQCISQGPIDTEIKGEVSGNKIRFELDDIGDLRIPKTFEFEIFDENFCILHDRIQYTHDTSDFNPIVPIVCHLFYNGNTIKYVRFAMTNPDRLIEFYGRLISYGKPLEIKGLSSSSTSGITFADDVIKELSGYGMCKADALMERATKLFNGQAELRGNSDVRKSLESIKQYLECLKLYVKAYQLDNKNGGGLKPKLLMFIALCNYKIGNNKQAYCVAMQGLDAVENAVQNSVFIGIPRSIYGEDNLKELVEVIDKKHYNEVPHDRDAFYECDPTDIDTTYVDKCVRAFEELEQVRQKPTQDTIKKLIEVINRVQKQFSLAGKNLGDPMKAFQLNHFLETFKMPLYFAWQGYDYGWHTDFCEEGDSLFPFMMFETDLIKNTKELIELLQTNSPFASIEKNSAITNALIAVYTTFVEDLEEGKINI